MEWIVPFLIGIKMSYDVVAKTHQKEGEATMNMATVDLDITKSVFHFIGVNKI